MTNINSAMLIGNLVRDISVSKVGSGISKGDFTLAINRSVKKGESWVDEVSYIDCVIWGKTADNLAQYLTKGTKVGVSGYLKQDRWEKDGQKHNKIYIVAEQIELCGSRNGSNNAAPASNDYGFTEDMPF